jgi:hypothetical protein
MTEDNGIILFINREKIDKYLRFPHSSKNVYAQNANHKKWMANQYKIGKNIFFCTSLKFYTITIVEFVPLNKKVEAKL